MLSKSAHDNILDQCNTTNSYVKAGSGGKGVTLLHRGSVPIVWRLKEELKKKEGK